jgi:hypothetical protein
VILNIVLNENKRENGSGGKARKKTYATTGLSKRKERILETERGNTRSHSVENST